MHIPIPIPIGATHVAAVQGAVWKHVTCATCRQPFAYSLEVQATGQDHDLLFLDSKGSAARAQAQAERNLLEKSQNIVVPIPCPGCGCYQDDMARQLKDDASLNWFQIAGGIVVALSLVPLVFGIAYLWILTVVLAIAGLNLLVYGYVLAFRFDPNAGDPEPRKILGRQHALWGEQLAGLPAMEPESGSGG